MRKFTIVDAYILKEEKPEINIQTNFRTSGTRRRTS